MMGTVEEQALEMQEAIEVIEVEAGRLDAEINRLQWALGSTAAVIALRGIHRLIWSASGRARISLYALNAAASRVQEQTTEPRKDETEGSK